MRRWWITLIVCGWVLGCSESAPPADGGHRTDGGGMMDGGTETDGGSEEDGGSEPGLSMGASCTEDAECASANCYIVPFVGGQCGECNEDADCTGGGCTSPNPFMNNGSTCNMGELGAGCETSEVCADGRLCGTVLSLLGLIELSTCGECLTDSECTGGTICAPVVDVPTWSGINTCVAPRSLPQNSYCLLEGNGNDACMSGICSTVDIMGIAQLGACGECNRDADCTGGQTCVAGEFILDGATLTGSRCM